MQFLWLAHATPIPLCGFNSALSWYFAVPDKPYLCIVNGSNQTPKNVYPILIFYRFTKIPERACMRRQRVGSGMSDPRRGCQDPWCQLRSPGIRLLRVQTGDRWRLLRRRFWGIVWVCLSSMSREGLLHDSREPTGVQRPLCQHKEVPLCSLCVCTNRAGNWRYVLILFTSAFFSLEKSSPNITRPDGHFKMRARLNWLAWNFIFERARPFSLCKGHFHLEIF